MSRGGGGVVMPNGLAGAQGRDTFAWEGNKDNRDDQLCGSISFKLSDYSTVFGEGKGVSPKGFHGGYAARDTGRLGYTCTGCGDWPGSRTWSSSWPK